MTFYTTQQLNRFPWIVCDRASLRDCDLADAFQSAIAEIAALRGEPVRPDGMPESFPAEHAATLERLASHCGNCMGPDEQPGDREAIENAIAWLDDAAPYGFWFGSNEGDGSLFGFWLGDDATETLEDAGQCPDDPATAALAVWRADYPHGPESVALADQLVANPCAWPGGYPMLAVTDYGGTLCRHCCASERDSIASTTGSDGWRVMALTVNWEDPELYCSHCGNRIESAYAEHTVLF